MKTILQFITGLDYGGAENMMYKTIEHLDKKKYKIIIASLVGGTLEKELRKKYKIYMLNCNTLLHLPIAILKLRKILKKEKVDILHSYLFHANIVARFSAVGTRAKVISSIRIKEIVKNSHNIIDSWTSWFVDKYTCVSESVRNFVIEKEKINPEKIITIQNGLDFSKFHFKTDSENKLKELNVKRPVLISVANLRTTKDYVTLFKAVSVILNDIEIHLLVVGKGECEEEYKKIVSELRLEKYVHFLGYRADVLELVSVSDICVLSTFYEGQSNSLLEYMALKKPIVATDVEENREVITDEVEGLLVPPKNPKKMAEAIIRLLKDDVLRTKLINNAYEKVKKEHDILRVAKQTEKLYEELT